MGIRTFIRGIVRPTPQIFCTVTTVEASNQLIDKVVLITGGASGIGEAIAEKVALEGAKVIIVGRREDKLKVVSEKIGANCKYLVYDVTDFNGELNWFTKLEDMFGTPITSLVNNAGIYIDKRGGQYSLDDYEKIMRVNLKAPYFMTQAFINYCKALGHVGNVVMIASNRALFGDDGPYGISKAALVNAVQGFARENIHRVRVNAVAPGMTASEINNVDVNGNLHIDSAKGKRVLLPYEIAEVVGFLLSDSSKCITGAVIPCDEGDCLR